MLEQIQNQRHPLCEAKTAQVVAEAARAAANSKFQFLTASKSALQGEVFQLTGSVDELGDEDARMRQRATIRCKMSF